MFIKQSSQDVMPSLFCSADNIQQWVARPANLHDCSTDYHLSEWFDE